MAVGDGRGGRGPGGDLSSTQARAQCGPSVPLTWAATGVAVTSGGIPVASRPARLARNACTLPVSSQVATGGAPGAAQARWIARTLGDGHALQDGDLDGGQLPHRARWGGRVAGGDLRRADPAGGGTVIAGAGSAAGVPPRPACGGTASIGAAAIASLRRGPGGSAATCWAAVLCVGGVEDRPIEVIVSATA